MPAKGPLQSVQVFGRKVSKIVEFIPHVVLWPPCIASAQLASLANVKRWFVVVLH